MLAFDAEELLPVTAGAVTVVLVLSTDVELAAAVLSPVAELVIVALLPVV